MIAKKVSNENSDKKCNKATRQQQQKISNEDENKSARTATRSNTMTKNKENCDKKK